jgi:recombination protein RecA
MPTKKKTATVEVIPTAAGLPVMDRKALAGIEALRGKLEKQYGKAVTRQDREPPKYEIISSGSLALDYATVVGGYVRGRIHLLWGPEGVGKTTAVIKAMAEAQRAYPNLAVVFIDMEQTFDFDWAAENGLDTSEHRFIHLFPDHSEDVADMLKQNCQSGYISMAVVDSVGGMVTKKASEKDADESDMGKNSQVVTRMCQVTAVAARQNQVAVLIVSQVRANFSSPTGGDTYAAPKALRHATTMVLKFRRADKAIMQKIDGEDIPVGQPIAIKVERSKVAPGGRTAFTTILNVPTEKYGPIGVDVVDEAMTVGKKPTVNAIVQGGGGYYTLPDGERVRGEDAAKEYLRSNPDVLRQVWDKALESVKKMVVEEKPELAFVQGDPDEPGDGPVFNPTTGADFG